MSLLYFEAPATESARLHPRDLAGACFEHGTRALLLDHGALPPAFFDLSSGVAGDLMQRLANYGLRMAAVVPEPRVHAESFQDFAREASAFSQFRFFRTRAEAVQWLNTPK